MKTAIRRRFPAAPAVLLGLVFLGVWALGCAAWAQGTPGGSTVYRITLPDGRVVLTDRPPEKTAGTPANAKVETLQTLPPRSAAETAAAKERLQRDRAALERARAERQAASTVSAQRDARVAAAQQRVLEAEARQKAAAEPREGDFTANAGGGTRLNDAFHARQAQAAADVAAARAALDAAMMQR